jgi:hypothetical protein
VGFNESGLFRGPKAYRGDLDLHLSAVKRSRASE